MSSVAIATEIVGRGHGHAGNPTMDMMDTAKRLGHPISYDTAWTIECALRAAHDAGCRTDWGEATQALERAYRALGEQNPANGYAWHCGVHPVQLAAERHREADEAMYDPPSTHSPECPAALGPEERAARKSRKTARHRANVATRRP